MASIVVGLVAVVVFAGLHGCVVRDNVVVRVDSTITDWMVAHRFQALTSVMRAITDLGDFRAILVVVVASAVLLVIRGHRGLALVLVASNIGTWLLVNGAKSVVRRPRPPIADHAVAARGWAFPSGHAGQGVATYLCLALIVCLVTERRQVRIVAVSIGAALAVAIGVSRIYLGVHWMTDVIAGWAVAIGWLAGLTAVRSLRRPAVRSSPEQWRSGTTQRSSGRGVPDT